MKNPYEVLRIKEQEVQRVKREIEALRIAARLLGGEAPPSSEESEPDRQVIEMP
jgi:branched-subunit amino acid aminotransferase/4-amino-4-deoxychorismate lyase